MSEQFALHPDESGVDEAALLVDEAQPAQEVVRPRYLRFARLVSNVLAPAPVSIPMIVLVSFYQARSVVSALAYASLALLFLSIGPFGYVLVGVRLGKLSDVDVSRRNERTGPFIFGLISVCLGWLVMVLIHAPAILVTCLIITAVSGLVMLLTTLRWKISIHASSLAGVATMLTVLYGAVMLPTFGLLILVNWSRVVLRRHTIGQVITGSLLSITLTTLILKWRGF